MKATAVALAVCLVMSVAYADTTTPKTHTATLNKTSVTKKLKKKRRKKKKAHRRSAQLRKAHLRKAEVLRTTPIKRDRIQTSAAAESMVGSAGSANISATTLGGNSEFQKLRNTLALTYFGVYHGPSLSHIGTAYQPDTSGNIDHTAPQNLESYITAGYKPKKDWTVGVMSHFFYNGSDTLNAKTNAVDMSSGIEMLDPFLVVQKSNLINSGPWNLTGFLYVELPTSQNDFLRENSQQLLTSVSPTWNLTYNVKGTRWSLGTYGFLRGYIASANSPYNSRSYKFYVAPWVNYQATPTVSATLWVDLVQLTRTGGSPLLSPYGMNNAETDIEPGINWDIIPGSLSINPILNIYPGNMTLAATSFQTVIIGRLF